MKELKRRWKRNTHNSLFKILAGLGRSLNRLYENRNHDILSNGEVAVIKKLSSFNPAVIIDGGANDGEYSIWLSKYNSNAKIYSFEPVEKTFNQLSVAVTGYKNVIPVKMGLFSNNCTKKINIYDSSAHASIHDIKDGSYNQTGEEEIVLVSGDSFARDHKIDEIDFVKLDLEGAEFDAILGFDGLLKRKKIRAIQFEYGYINIITKKLLIDFCNLLNEYGYVVGKIFPKNVEFRSYEFKHEDFIGPNFIAIRKDDKELMGCLCKK
jgi:FkbM family methyltransferase